MYTFELSLPDLISVLEATSIGVELGPISEHPLNGELYEAGGFTPPLEHIGQVAVHEAAVVLKTELLYTFDCTVADKPVWGAESLWLDAKLL